MPKSKGLTFLALSSVTLVEVLWPVLARRANFIIDCRDLESGGALTLDYMCYGTQELDRQRVSVGPNAAHIQGEPVLREE